MQNLPRVWPAALIVATYWIVAYLPRWFEARIFVSFLACVATSTALILAFWTWWFTNRTIPLGDRLLVFGANLAGAIVAGLCCHKSLGPMGILMFGVPAVFSSWALWMLLARRMSPGVRSWGLALLLWLCWSGVALVRIDGVDGDTRSRISWRWTRTPEEIYLAENAAAASAPPSQPQSGQPQPGEPKPGTLGRVDAPILQSQSGDWPGFRGPERDSGVRGVRLATDWNASPPRPLWRRRIGPGWSSFVVLGDRLYTQEQRGEAETVVCLAADTGDEIWAHADPVRFSDGQAGAGPRATPTFADGCIYTFGATGLLNCLNATSGQMLWSRDVTADCDGKAPLWGFASSPLVAEGLVVVYAGGAIDQALLAYDARSGEPAWKAPTGEVSYCSPQLAAIDGESQILFLSERGLTSVAARSGNVLWNHAAPRGNIWRVVQPRVVGERQVLIGSEDLGLVLVDVAHAPDGSSASQQWASAAIRPAYNDFVVHDGHAYGFDGAIFCCVELTSGTRRWKAGRYGHGQVLLLADQPLLVVLTETGEAVLLAARPDRHEELGRFSALEGKCWSHPVIAHGRLFIRNDEQMACYALKLLDSK